MSTSDDHHQILFSTDGHCGAEVRGYKPYLERRYHEAFDSWADGFHDAWAEETDQQRDANHRVGIASMMAPLNCKERKTKGSNSLTKNLVRALPGLSPSFILRLVAACWSSTRNQ